MRHALRSALAATIFAFAAGALAEPVEPVLAQARANRQPLLDTLKQLVEIESGSDDREGLDRISGGIAGKLKALGGEVEFIEPGADAYRMGDTPAKIGRMVKATFRGTGTKKILMIAHMDTVYRRGMLARQPFRVEGDKAYGLAIADDKQGVAAIIHIVAMLKALGFRDFGTLTVLINGDEEVSSPGARAQITKNGAEHDATLSFEATRVNSDKLSLATSGIGGVIIKVKGKASHSGSSPERGINALVELSNQILQTTDLSDPATGLKMNWTNAKAGSGSHNVIPESAEAFADVRVNQVADYDRIEREDTKTDIGWGHQIRSYVLDQSRIKDLRTNVESARTSWWTPSPKAAAPMPRSPRSRRATRWSSASACRASGRIRPRTSTFSCRASSRGCTLPRGSSWTCPKGKFLDLASATSAK